MNQHYQQLDGLRGLAIFGVFLSHFIVPQIGDWHYFAFGSLGVRLFFVLSGFLITGILLRSKTLVESGQSISYTLKAFYFRRTLRVFFVYYAWLAFIAIFVYRDQRLVWDFLYLSNFYDMIYLQGHGNQYWSLAVEEQFYIVWPFFILFCPRRYLRSTLVGLVSGVIAIRFYLGLTGEEYLLIKKFPILCVDALGIGGLIALLHQNRSAFEALKTKRIVLSLAIIGAVITVAAMSDVWLKGAKSPLYSALLHTGFAIASGGLLLGAVKGYTGFLGRFLSFRPLCFLGTVSYGCYLYHLAVHSWVEGFLGAAETDFGLVSLVLIFTLKVLLTLIVASISWFCFEKPMNGFKDWFPMDSKRCIYSRAEILRSLRESIIWIKLKIERV